MTFIVVGGYNCIDRCNCIFSELTLKIGLAFWLALFFVQVVVQIKRQRFGIFIDVCANAYAGGYNNYDK